MSIPHRRPDLTGRVAAVLQVGAASLPGGSFLARGLVAVGGHGRSGIDQRWSNPAAHFRFGRWKGWPASPVGSGEGTEIHLMTSRGYESRLALPDFPGRAVARPKVVEVADIAQRIHTLPEPRVTVGMEMSLARESFERFGLPVSLVALDVVHHAGLQYKEPAVDPTFAGLGLFGEP